MQPTALVADASLVVALFVESDRTQAAEHIFSTTATLFAPDLLVAETANALWTYERASRRPATAASEFVERLSERVQLVPSRALVADAFVIARDLDHPVYDALYLALARREKTQVVTFDQRLLQKIAGTRYASLAVSPR